MASLVPANEIQTCISTHSPDGSTEMFQQPLKPSESSFAHELLFFLLFCQPTLSLLTLSVKGLTFLQLL